MKNRAIRVLLFLITDTTGHSDLPEDAGWTVISDQNGGDNNYVELEASSLNSEYNLSWTLKPSSVESTNFYLSIHHGGENNPFFGISSALSVTPQVVPENLPRLSSDYAPFLAAATIYFPLLLRAISLGSVASLEPLDTLLSQTY